MQVPICAVALTAMQATRLFLDGIWVVEAHDDNATKKTDVIYTIETTDWEWQMDGEITTQNKMASNRLHTFQMRWKIPDGKKPVVTDGDVCWEWSQRVIVAEWKTAVGPLQTEVVPIDWAIRLHHVADINEDGIVDGEDRGILFADWQTDSQRSDLNRDGVVNGEDLGLLNVCWGWKLVIQSEDP